MLVVNLFGAPGSGKSTGAAYIFSQLKIAGVNAELVTEFVKDKVWENNEEVFKNQAYIFGNGRHSAAMPCLKSDENQRTNILASTNTICRGSTIF